VEFAGAVGAALGKLTGWIDGEAAKHTARRTAITIAAITTAAITSLQ
jgi:hypothetical protein